MDIEKLRTEAKSWLGTPHRNKLCKKGVGVDCINFVLSCYIAGGVNYKLINYDPLSGLHKFSGLIEKELLKTGDFVKVENPEDGCILIFDEIKFSAHVGLYLDGMVYHAMYNRLVSAQPFLQWKKHIYAIYKYNK